MKTTGSDLTPPIDMEQQLREINEALLVSSIRQHELTEQAQKAEQALRETQAQLELELTDTKLLQSISAEITLEQNVEELYEKILDAAVAIMRSDYASMQMLHPERGSGGELLLLAFRGFNPEAAKFWKWVRADSQCTCGVTLSTRQRTIATNIEECDYMAGSEDLAACLQTGIHAVQTTPLFSRGGTLVGMISTHWNKPHEPTERDLRLLDILARQAADLIERKKVEQNLVESEERYRSLVSVITDVTWTTDAKGAFVTPQTAWEAYTGQTWEEHRGFGWADALHPEDRERVKEIWEHSLTSRALYKSDGRLWHAPSQQWRHFVARATLVLDANGSVREWVGNCTDVEDRKRSEAEREGLLDSEQQARREADVANRMKDEFLATVSHELRTPLNAIMGWTHILMRGRLDEETAARGLKAVARNANAQNQLISDLLDVSRIISGQFRFESSVVDLIPVIEAATETVRPAANAKGIVLQLKLDSAAGLVSGDGARLQQIVWNLLTNAVKFTSRDGHVEVRLKRQDTGVAIIVNDSGEGISPEFLPHIFDRFRQAESTTKRQHGGLGLGLAIVRHLVEAHGGTIRAASKGLGQGAIFTVTLPLIAVSRDGSGVDHTEAGKGLVDHASPTILNGLRVLVIDDEPDARELLTIALRQSGAKVRSAATVQVALDILDQWKPDVLVSDIGMPGEDGYDLIRRVRALESKRGGTIPALALTGYASSEDAMRAREAGFQTHMSKPVAPGDLVVAVASLAAEGPPM